MDKWDPHRFNHINDTQIRGDYAVLFKEVWKIWFWCSVGFALKTNKFMQILGSFVSQQSK